jgi:hypothetical protein
VRSCSWYLRHEHVLNAPVIHMCSMPAAVVGNRYNHAELGGSRGDEGG